MEEKERDKKGRKKQDENKITGKRKSKEEVERELEHRDELEERI